MWKTVNIYNTNTGDSYRCRLVDIPRIDETVTYFNEGQKISAKVTDVIHECELVDYSNINSDVTMVKNNTVIFIS